MSGSSDFSFERLLVSLCDELFSCCVMSQVAQNYFMQAAEAGNANAMAFLGKVMPIRSIWCKLMTRLIFIYFYSAMPHFTACLCLVIPSK